MLVKGSPDNASAQTNFTVETEQVNPLDVTNFVGGSAAAGMPAE